MRPGETYTLKNTKCPQAIRLAEMELVSSVSERLSISVIMETWVAQGLGRVNLNAKGCEFDPRQLPGLLFREQITGAKLFKQS